MASSWAKDLPVVTIPPDGNTPKSVTFVYPFYENHEFLEFHPHIWRQYKPFMCLEAIIVDDGSPQPLDVESLKCVCKKCAHRPLCPFPIRMFRIEQDVPWNWLAARNIGAYHARDGWVLLTDMDHVVPLETVYGLVYGNHDPSVIYAFSRREHTGEAVTPHSASFFMTRDLFWKIGGYDEALSGYYGTDGIYRREAAKHAQFKVLTDVLIRFENVDDSSTSRYPRKLPADAAAVKRIVAARGKDWRPKVLSFPYHEVTVNESVCSAL